MGYNKSRKWGVFVRNYLKKFKTKFSAIVIGAIIDIVILILYIICLHILKGNPENINIYAAVALDIISNILLVGLSILTTSLISIPFIDVRGKNQLCAELLLGDVLKTPEVFNILSKDQKEDLLHSLECSLYFDNQGPKEEMLRSVRNKINGISQNNGLTDFSQIYFNTCEYDVDCSFNGNYIIKKFTKNIEICAYRKKTVSNFLLCRSIFAKIDDLESPSITSLNIDGSEIDINKFVKREEEKASSAFDKRGGYKENVVLYYTGKLELSPEKPVKIMVSYITTVSSNDVSYSCRMACPCNKFKFTFRLTGDQAKDYYLAVNAFGFWDDGKKTPNPPDENKIFVHFDDWIFPRDGVSVTLVRKDPQNES